jgi:hypothetical protein
MPVETAEKQKSLVAELRPSFIRLSEINGVDFEAKTVTRSPDFANPRNYIRKSTLNRLGTCEKPILMTPIIVYIDNGGVVELLDGDHRVISQLLKCDGNMESDWARIRATKFLGTREEAMIYARTNGLDAYRTNLDDAETVGVVKWCLDYGMEESAIIEKIGRKSKQLVTKIKAICNASPEVLAAALKGEIEIETGAKIAKKDLSEQGSTVDKVIEEKEKAGGNEQSARKNTGLVERRTILNLKMVELMLWPHWENYCNMMEGHLGRDKWTIGYVGAILRVLKLAPDDGNRQPGIDGEGDLHTWEQVRERIDPAFALYQQFINNPPKTRNRKKKGE